MKTIETVHKNQTDFASYKSLDLLFLPFSFFFFPFFFSQSQVYRNKGLCLNYCPANYTKKFGLKQFH